MKGHNEEREQYVLLDSRKLNEVRLLKGLSRNKFSTLSGLSQRAVARVFGGKRVRIDTALLALKTLGFDSLKGMLLDADAAPESNSELGEWQVEKELTPWIPTSNGLLYRRGLSLSEIPDSGSICASGKMLPL